MSCRRRGDGENEMRLGWPLVRRSNRWPEGLLEFVVPEIGPCWGSVVSLICLHALAFFLRTFGYCACSQPCREGYPSYGRKGRNGKHEKRRGKRKVCLPYLKYMRPLLPTFATVNWRPSRPPEPPSGVISAFSQLPPLLARSVRFLSSCDRRSVMGTRGFATVAVAATRVLSFLPALPDISESIFPPKATGLCGEPPLNLAWCSIFARGLKE